MNRRNFIRNTGLGLAGSFGAGQFLTANPLSSSSQHTFFDISLAQWSLHRMLFDNKISNLNFPSYAKEEFDINAVEYVNQFFPSAGSKYIQQLKRRADDAGVKSLLIMIDGEGMLGDQYKPQRMRAIERHYPWVEAAALLGCHSIRVNAAGNGSREEVANSVIDSLVQLAEYSANVGINILVENHGGYSSDGEWLANVIENTGMNNCGTLPDFGNFRVNKNNLYDRYKGMRELMPYAKGVSAKSYDFDNKGNESHIDYYRMLKIVKDAGYEDYIGIEYEGSKIIEIEGIKATKQLLLRAAAEI